MNPNHPSIPPPPVYNLAVAAADPNRTSKNEGVWVGSAAAEAPDPHCEAMGIRTGGPEVRPDGGPGSTLRTCGQAGRASRRRLAREYDHVEGGSKIATATLDQHTPIAADDRRVAQPIFTLRETAAYLGLPKSNVHRWARPADGAPLITCLPAHGRQASVPFIGFAEAFVLSSFRKAKVPLQRIRPAVEVLKSEIGLEHALASKRLYTDGAEVLYDYANEQGDGELGDLVVLRTKQRQFSALVKSYLKRIDYGGDGWAASVKLLTYAGADVIVDPTVAFGLPLLVDGGARVEDLVHRFQAGDSVSLIADDFGVPATQVEDVIRVATKLAA